MHVPESPRGQVSMTSSPGPWELLPRPGDRTPDGINRDPVAKVLPVIDEYGDDDVKWSDLWKVWSGSFTHH